MGFLDSLSKTFSSGVDRAKFEADKFQRTSRISGEVNNIKSQIDTNIRQLGERALELYQQGMITAPEIASLADIVSQLRAQQAEKEAELNEAQAYTFEQFQAENPRSEQAAPAQNVPIMTESDTVPADPAQTPPTMTGAYDPTTPATTSASVPTPTYGGRSYTVPESTDLSGSGQPNASSVGGHQVTSTTPDATINCPNCGYAVPGNAAFCPNCGTRVRTI